jgi:hypothetical protein
MRPSALLLAALFLTPLAGCLGATAATAGEVAAKARSIAHDWDADAALQGIAGIELKEMPPFLAAAAAQAGTDSPQAQLLQYHDSNVGDGRAGAWIFGFRAGERELLLAIDAGGRELLRHVDDDDRGSRGERPIGEFAIDSDDAMRLAAEHNATFAGQRGGAVVASLALMPGPAGPVWLLALGASFDDLDDTAFAMVDATSGNVTITPDLDAAFSSASGTAEADAGGMGSPYYHPRGNRTFVPTETGSERGTLSVADPDQGSPFEVESAGHGKLRLQLSLPRAAPPTQATATVTGPDGRTATVTFTAALTGSGPATAELDAPHAGRYTVAVHLDAGVLQQYDLAWCAPGSRMAAQDASSACGEA